MRFVIGIVVLALSCMASANSEYSPVGYGSSGYASVGYGSVGYGTDTPDSLVMPESLQVESVTLENIDSSSVKEDAILPVGDGSLGYRAAIQRGWLSFANGIDDENFKELTGFGFSFGGYKSFDVNKMFEIISGADIDTRLIWGNYRYTYKDENSVEEHFRLGGLFTLDIRAMVMFRMNFSIFYAEVGPQFGFNILQSAMVKFEDYFDYSQEDLGVFIFAIAPGGGIRLKNMDLGARFVPDVTNCWKRSKASMISVQFAVTFWQ